MSWWKKLFIPGELSARVYLHEISATGGRIPCWLYVSDGLGAHQHREVVFTLRRKSGEADAAFPEDPLGLFGTLYRLAAQGKRVTVGGCTELGARRFLTDASWAEFRRALFEGTDLVIPATGGGMDFALTWRDDIYADVLP